MSSDSIDIELVSVESAMLVPYEVAPSKPVKKKDLGKKIGEFVFTQKISANTGACGETGSLWQQVAVWGARS